MLVSDFTFSASLLAGEAMLRFPYDERLRQLLRAIPGRRWDPGERAWCIPLDPERAEALARLFAGLPGEPRVSDALARAIERRRARRRRDECVLDLARPDENWWLSFATDTAPELAPALLEHPQARRLPTIGRAVIPLDDRSAQLVDELDTTRSSLRLSDVARRALFAPTGREGGPPPFTSPLERTRSWRGSIEVDGPSERPVFLLLGDVGRLPQALREGAVSAPGGAAVPLTLDSWRLIDGQLGGWISAAARRCVAALKEGRPAPPAVLERSVVHDEETFVLAPGHDAALLEQFAALTGALPCAPRRAVQHEHARIPAIRADPFCVEELDGLLAAHEIWVEPDALALLQEVREEHARAAGLVALSAATDAPLHVPGLGGELKPFQRAGVNYLLSQRRAFLADEQGLGKTIEALATLEADGAYPAVVVCPASLKLNWLRELERWLPARTVQVLVGTGAGAPVAASDITIVNYDIVGARLDALRALAPRALVLDESHYCKNAAAKRTQAVQRLSAVVPQEGLVLALTGTPVMNRPAELISQLRILGRLGDFGSGVQFGKRFRGPTPTCACTGICARAASSVA